MKMIIVKRSYRLLFIHSYGSQQVWIMNELIKIFVISD